MNKVVDVSKVGGADSLVVFRSSLDNFTESILLNGGVVISTWVLMHKKEKECKVHSNTNFKSDSYAALPEMLERVLMWSEVMPKKESLAIHEGLGIKHTSDTWLTRLLGSLANCLITCLTNSLISLPCTNDGLCNTDNADNADKAMLVYDKYYEAKAGIAVGGEMADDGELHLSVSQSKPGGLEIGTGKTVSRYGINCVSTSDGSQYRKNYQFGHKLHAIVTARVVEAVQACKIGASLAHKNDPQKHNTKGDQLVDTVLNVRLSQREATTTTGWSSNVRGEQYNNAYLDLGYDVKTIIGDIFRIVFFPAHKDLPANVFAMNNMNFEFIFACNDKYNMSSNNEAGACSIDQSDIRLNDILGRIPSYLVENITLTRHCPRTEKQYVLYVLYNWCDGYERYSFSFTCHISGRGGHVGMTTLMTLTLPEGLNNVDLGAVDCVKIEDNEQQLEKILQSNFDLIDTLVFVYVNKMFKFACICKRDRIVAHKGSVLYAPPALPDEHFVFLSINYNKGGTISYTRSNYKTFLLISENLIRTKQSKSQQTLFIRMTKTLLGLLVRHAIVVIKLALMNDIESNPGPEISRTDRSQLTIISQNCRGLGNMDKTRLLLNKVYALPRPQIVLLQETMVTNSKYLELAWRGKFVQTNGTGNSRGCITLVGADCDISEVKHYGTRGHVFKLKLSTGELIKVCNIYAPNGFDANKVDFLNMVFLDLANWDGLTIIGGDFNVTLGPGERHNRGVTTAELRVAELLKEHTHNQNLDDCWEGRAGFTWRKGRSMSRLDRIYTRAPDFKMTKLNINWALTASDHAGLVLTLEHRHRSVHKNEHVKLDNRVVHNKETLAELIEYVTEQLSTATDMTPHVRLEFAKMTIRTKALEIMSRTKRKENERLSEVNNSIKENMRLLAVYTDQQSHMILTAELEELEAERNEILSKQGATLAQRAKTKWYNEGERSNKYFLNLLKRQSDNSEMKSLLVNDQDITDSVEIREKVTQFYHELYNKNEASLSVDEHFLDGLFQVDEVDNEGIGAPVTIEELWLTLKNTKATTPGPDGLSNTYLKRLWVIIGPLILAAWYHSVRTKDLPPSH